MSAVMGQGRLDGYYWVRESGEWIILNWISYAEGPEEDGYLDCMVAGAWEPESDRTRRPYHDDDFDRIVGPILSPDDSVESPPQGRSELKICPHPADCTTTSPKDLI